VGVNLDRIQANIERGRAVLQTADSALDFLDRSAAVVQEAISVGHDVAQTIQVWNADGPPGSAGSTESAAADPLQRRRAELAVWPLLAAHTGPNAAPNTDWLAVVRSVASHNPLGLAVTTAVTMFDDYLVRRVHEQGYEKLTDAVDRGFAGVRNTLGDGLQLGLAVTTAVTMFEGYLERRVHEQGYEKLSDALDRGFAGVRDTLSDGLHALDLTIENGFQRLSAEFSWGLAELLWRADQQNQAVSEIRDLLTRPLDIQSKELRARAIRSYDNEWMEEALADFLDAMQKCRVDYVIAHYLGNIFLRKEDYRSASEWFGKSARWSRPEEPRHAAVALMHQALALSLLGTDEESAGQPDPIACLNDALDLNPTNSEARFQRAMFHAKAGNADAAIADLEDLIDRDGRYLVRTLIEPDFQWMANRIADLTYWLTKSYSKTIDRQLRQFGGLLRQFDDGISVDPVGAVINPYADDENAELFVQAVSLASSLYALGDFHSVQQAQNLLLTLQYPERRTGQERVWLPYPYGAAQTVAYGVRGSYHDFSYTFYGVGGDLV